MGGNPAVVNHRPPTALKLRRLSKQQVQPARARRRHDPTFVFLTATLAQTFIILNKPALAEGYDGVAAFPTIFLLAYLLSFGRIDHRNSRSPILLAVFTIIQWVRFVLMPTAIVAAGNSPGLPWLQPETYSLRLATTLIAVELLVTSVLVTTLARRPAAPREAKRPRVEGDSLVYVIFVAFAAVVYILFQGSSLLHFGALPAATGERLGDLTDTRSVAVRQVLLVALFVIFLLSVRFSAKRYVKTGSTFYIALPLAVALMNVVTIVGERRSNQVFTAFAVTAVLIAAFPALRQRIITTVWSSAGAVLILMTLYKTLNVFQYGSYGAAVESSEFGIANFSQTLQAYFAGPQVLAAAHEFSNTSGPGLKALIFDFMRSTMPISFLVKDSDEQLTTVAFNNYIYGTRQDTGQVLSSVAYGLIFLGPALSWIFGLFNVAVAYVLEQLATKARSLETILLGSYIFMRVGVNLTANPPAIISGVTMMLISAGLVFLLARAVASVVRQSLPSVRTSNQ